MQIVTDVISLEEVKRLAAHLFGHMIKGVVDIDRGLLALDAELHADLEALLVQEGSAKHSVWGITLYPEMVGEEFVEFTSMINMRPSQGNRSRTVEDAGIRAKILHVIAQRVQR